MIYAPDVGIHGNVTSKVDAESLRHEPSLTLCTLPIFSEWAGPISKRIFTEIAATSAFQRLAARARNDVNVSIRISVYVVWLKSGDFPSQRPDWHIDRVGGLTRQGNIELVDLRDPLCFPSFILTSIFQTESSSARDVDSPSTEFLLSSFPGRSGELWADMREMHVDIDEWLAKNPNPTILKPGNRTIASFSPRTVHRPGCASANGWRYLLRLGLYTTQEPCSPYPNHMVFYNPVWNSSTRAMTFRRTGDTTSRSDPDVRSVPLDTERGRIAALRFVESNFLRVDKTINNLSDLAEAAACKGLLQVIV